MKGRELLFGAIAAVIVVVYVALGLRFGAALVPVGGPTATPPKPVAPVGAPRVPGTIAFVIRGDVYVLRDGSYAPQTSEGRSLQPDLSPDGTTLVFARNDQIEGTRISDGQVVPARLGFSGIWRKGASGGAETQLLNGLRQRAGANGQHQVSWFLGPALSPDAKLLAFVEDDGDGNADLEVMDMATRRVTLLSHGSNLADPAWSPDGKTIAVTTYTSGVPGILLVGADGRGQGSRLPLPDGEQHHPSYSPDGAWVLYTLRHDGRDDLHAYDVGGKQDRALTTDGRSWDGVFSPDGRSVAFLREGDFVIDLYVMELGDALTAGAAPTAATKLTHGEGVSGASRPRWSR